MPISEQMFTGFATGAALAGRRCVVEYQIPSLLYLAFEQIANQAQKLRLMTGGQATVPVVYLVPGSGRAARARGAALRPPVLAVRPRGREDGAAGDAGGRVRADASRRSATTTRCSYLAPAAVLPVRGRAAGRAGAGADRQRPDPPRAGPT